MATQGRTAWKYVGSAALVGGEALKFSAANSVDVMTASTDKFVGIAAEACAAGNVTPQNISIWNPTNCPGTVQVLAGANNLAAGDWLTPTTGGKLIAAVPKATLSESEEFILGFANEASTSTSDVIEMVWLIHPTSIT